jgi:fibronectin type 3 domain-containing protein
MKFIQKRVCPCRKAAGFLLTFFVGLSLMVLVPFASAQLVHPGALSTQADLDRMTAKVAAGEQPWKGSWDILVGNQGFYMGGPEAVPTVFVDSGNGGNTYMNLARDSHRAYQAALRYHGSGNPIYADKAIQIMNAWSTTHTNWDGNSNVLLRMGLYGYAFACAAELMRGYNGWAPADFAAFQQYMRTQYYPGNSAWLAGQNNSHYWANWTLANMCSMLAIGVLCDDQAIVDEALNHFYNGVHTGGIQNSVYYVHPDGLGQWQESGRDQGHAQIGPQLIGTFCEIAWNQGYDLYSYLNNRVLAGVEYISKYNTGHAVPFAAYANSDYATWPHPYRFYQKDVAGLGGVSRPGWDLIYNHYVNRMGIAAPYTAKYAKAARPEGGGSNYGGNSGGFDGLGFTTLTHSRDPIATGAVPGTLLPRVQGRQITLSWAGSAYAQSYNVKRATTSGGPYTTLGTVDGDSLFYVDPGLTAGTTYYYVVSANNPGGESANSAEVVATADGQLFGTVIGTDYSWDHAGATKEILFDGVLGNFIDVGATGGGWAGLDLGAGASVVITGVKYYPRKGFANAMVGGKFQASNVPDFSSGVIDLFTITTAPPEGVLTFQAVNSGSAYRYVRYIQPNNGGWNTTAEVQFLGTSTGQNAPAVPVVNATLVNGLRIDLSWNPVPGARGYRIKRATNPGGPYVIFGDVNTGYNKTTEFSDVETEIGATYYYVVSAYNQLGESVDSTEVFCATLPPSPQLMTHLKMSGNVADSSGFNFQASAFGSPNYSTGYVGSALDLDGTEDFVTLPSRVADADEITVAAWVKWNGGGAWKRIFDFGTGTASYLYLTPSSANGTLRFGIKLGGEQFVEAPGLVVGTWTHVAVTLGGNTATLYVNGAPAASNSAVTIKPSDFKPGNNYIGKSQWGGDPLFNGRIDEFRIYNHALSAGAVAALAAQASETTPPGTPVELSATTSNGAVQLNWADNGEFDFASYNVYRSTLSGSGYSVIASGLTTSTHTDNTVGNGVTYFYVVTAVDTSGGESARSNWIAATPQGVPVVRYGMDGNTLDSSGNDNHAIVTGSPTYVAGQIGQTIDLNGSTDFLRIPSGVVRAVERMTVAAWVNWDGGGNWQRIFDFGDSTSRYLFLTPKSGSGTLRFAINNGKGEKITETSALAIGTWVHVAVTLNGDTAILYVGGAPVATNVYTINPTGFDFKPANNYIGKSQFGSDPLFNGRIDDFRIYNYALTASQVNDVKNGGAPGDDTTPPAVPTNLTATATGSSVSLDWADNTEPDFASYTVYRSATSGSGYASIATLTNSAYTDNAITEGATYYYVVTAADTAANESAVSAEASAILTTLALHLKFDETGGTLAADTSGGNRHAALVNGPTFTAGKINNGLTLASTSSQHATLPSGIVNGLTNCTIMGWVKLNTVANWQRIFDFGTGTTNYMFLTTQFGTGGSANKLRFAIRTPGVAENAANRLDSSATTPIGSWAHFAVVLSGSTGRLYLNGAQVAVSTTMTLNPSSLGGTTLNYLGRSQFNDPYLNASLDDFRIYSRALTAGEIAMFQTQLGAPTGLIAAPGNTQVQLSWNAVANAASYTLSRSGNSGGPFASIAQLSGTSFTDTNVGNSGTYYYVVRAANFTGESPDSLPVSAQLVSLVPPNLSFAISNGELQFSWPGDHVGWRLQMTTNLAAPDWQDIAGSEESNFFSISPTNGNAFFRLVYP